MTSAFGPRTTPDLPLGSDLLNDKERLVQSSSTIRSLESQLTAVSQENESLKSKLNEVEHYIGDSGNTVLVTRLRQLEDDLNRERLENVSLRGEVQSLRQRMMQTVGVMDPNQDDERYAESETHYGMGAADGAATGVSGGHTGGGQSVAMTGAGTGQSLYRSLGNANNRDVAILMAKVDDLQDALQRERDVSTRAGLIMKQKWLSEKDEQSKSELARLKQTVKDQSSMIQDLRKLLAAAQINHSSHQAKVPSSGSSASQSKAASSSAQQQQFSISPSSDWLGISRDDPRATVTTLGTQGGGITRMPPPPRGTVGVAASGVPSPVTVHQVAASAPGGQSSRAVATANYIIHQGAMSSALSGGGGAAARKAFLQ